MEAYMAAENKKWSRRDFLKTAAAATLGSAMMTLHQAADASGGSEQKVPMRPFGKSGIDVSILSLGGMFDIPSNQLLLKQAVRWGVTYWDTADCYGGGRSEKGIGKYFSRYPQDRKKVFLVTKSDARDPKGMTRLLDRSLKRMDTSYVDLYFVHGIRSIFEIDGDTRKWAEDAKAAGKIRLFGFSTHGNMESCMIGAAKLGWIDGIMMSYNYRLMHTERMERAIDACREAGIGLTAMKTQGGGQVRTSTEKELELAGRFMKNGFTDGQAKLKAVWENNGIASICSQMPNLTLLMTNAAAAMDRTKLSRTDIRLLEEYAGQTASGYCSGCTHLCEAAIDYRIPIGDVMRCLMYSRSYGERDRAAALFHGLAPNICESIVKEDFSGAEKRCPCRMAIGKLMQAAVDEFA
jgi:uncharacterized protein